MRLKHWTQHQQQELSLRTLLLVLETTHFSVYAVCAVLFISFVFSSIEICFYLAYSMNTIIPHCWNIYNMLFRASLISGFFAHYCKENFNNLDIILLQHRSTVLQTNSLLMCMHVISEFIQLFAVDTWSQ